MSALLALARRARANRDLQWLALWIAFVIGFAALPRYLP